MTDLPLTIALAMMVGFQSGVIASWRFYKKQRDDHDAMRRRYDRQIDILENDLEERYRSEDNVRAITRGRHSR
jgi:hypothetical protein